MFCVGLTGSIASGKSTVLGFFKSLGAEILSADVIAKALTTKEQPAFKKIVSHFGEDILTSSGELNRRHLRELIFKEPRERLWLENLLHPLIRKEIETKINQFKSPYCLIEIPLLTDKANYPYLNRILVVEASPEQLISRYLARDQGTKEELHAILSTQTNAIDKRFIADDLLMNTDSLLHLQEKVRTLHEQYLQYANSLVKVEKNRE